MKRVLILLCCLLLVVCVFASCDDETTAPTNDPQQPQQHVHTFATTWSKDAEGHWYEATCDCADLLPNKLGHADLNNDGACDICTFTDHTHTYSEEWTADCTNHWNAAACGHVVAGANLAAHEDTTGDGKCDTCGYMIEDIHVHIYDRDYTTDESYHWYAPICEHADAPVTKEAHVINDAGFCTVCLKQVNVIPAENMLAILKAAVANNHKVTSGNVTASQTVYGGSEFTNTLTIETKLTNEVFFTLGNEASYIFWKTFDRNDAYIGGDHQWYQKLSDTDLFGVQMEAGSYVLKPIAAQPQHFNGYNYTPGSIMAAGYDNTETLAQTLYNLYDIMVKNVNVSDAEQGYDAETGAYSFSYTFFTVNSTPMSDGTMHYEAELYDVVVEFHVDDNYVINAAEFTVTVYRDFENDDDLAYDPDSNVVTKNAGANPSVYHYVVGQTSGERTYTTPYPKQSLMPIDFEFSYVTEYDFPEAFQFNLISEVPVEDTVNLTVGEYAYFHLGKPVPSSASFDFLDTSDFKFSFVNNDPESDYIMWDVNDTLLNGYSAYTNCLKIKILQPGTYTVTVEFGGLTKTFTAVVTGDYTPPEEEGGDDNEGGDTLDITGTYTADGITVVIDAENITVTPASGAVKVCPYVIENGKVVITNPDYNTVYHDSIVKLTLTNGVPTAIKWMAEDYTFTTSGGGDVGGDDEGDQLEGSGTEGDPYVIPEAGDYTCAFPGGLVPVWYSFTTTELGYISISSDFSGAWLMFGADPYAYSHSNEGNGNLMNILVAAGTYYIGVGDWAEYEANVPFTVSFEAASSDPIDNVVGTWSGNKTSPMGTYSYLFVINTDGTGTVSMNTGYGITEYTISMVFVDGDTVIINADGSWSSVSFEFTYSTDALTEVNGTLVLTPGSDNFDDGQGGEDVGGDDEEEEDISVEFDPLKGLVCGDYNLNGYYLSLYLDEYNTGKYIATIGNDAGTVNLTFSFEVTDNGDNTYTIALTHTATDYDAGADQLDALLAMDWIVTVDPIKKAVLGTYSFGDYTLYIYRDSTTGEYTANVYGTGFDLYFTYTVTVNANGTQTIVLTHMQKDFEVGAEEYLDAVLAYDFTIGEVLEGSGTTDAPYVLPEAGDYICAYPAEFFDLVWYKFTTTELGYITVSSAYSGNIWLKLGVDSNTATSNYDSMTPANYLKVLAPADEYYIGVADYDGHAAGIPFTVSFEAATSDAIDSVVGTWVGTKNSMTGSANYTITINADGTGTVSEDMGYFVGTFTITLVFVDGDTVIIQSADEWNNPCNFEFTYTTDTLTSTDGTMTMTPGEAEGGEEEPAETPLELGTTQISNVNATYTYTATEAGTLNLSAGAAIGGMVSVSYTVNDGDSTVLELSSNVDLVLAVGDVVVITIESEGYSSITATWTAEGGSSEGGEGGEGEGEGEGGGEAGSGSGTQTDPWIITEFPYTFTHQAGHDVYYKFTATMDGVVSIAAPSGCLVSGINTLPGYAKDYSTGVYSFNVTAGDVITFNPWDNTCGAEATYTISIAEATTPEPEPDPEPDPNPGEGEGDTTTDTAVKLVANGNYAGSTITNSNLSIAASAAEATTFYLEDAGNDLYHIYFLDGGVKTYLNCGISNSSLSFTTVQADATNYRLDATNSHIVVDGVSDWTGQNRVLVYDYASGVYVFRSKTTGNINGTSCIAMWYEIV